MSQTTITPKSTVCSLDWTTDKVQKIIQKRTLSSKDPSTREEVRKFTEFIKHCAISGVIFEIIISAPCGKSFYDQIIANNSALTPMQVIRLFDETEKDDELCRRSDVLEYFARHENSNRILLGRIAEVAKNKLRIMYISNVMDILLEHKNYTEELHEKIFFESNYYMRITSPVLLHKIIAFNRGTLATNKIKAAVEV